MRQQLLAVVGLLGFAAVGPAQQPYPGGYPGAGQGGFQQYPYPQYPGINPGNVMPNIYNPQTQPLSPYLNLLRGGNPGVNYYYGVRPGTVGGAGSFGGAAMLAPGGNRGAFFPQLAAAPDPLSLPEATDGYTLPSAGHPTVFNNTLGYFPGGMGGGRGVNRSGLSGVSNTARPATPRK